MTHPTPDTEPVILAGAVSFFIRSLVTLIASFVPSLDAGQQAQIIITCDAAIAVCAAYWQRKRVGSPRTMRQLRARAGERA